MSDSREDLEAVMKELEEKETTAQAANSLLEKEEKTEPVSKEEPAKEEKVEKEDLEKTLEEEIKDASKDPVKEEKEEKPLKEEPLLEQDKAPAGWSPKVREQWGTIPKEVRDEIIRREDASAKGVRQLQEEVAPMRGFVQQLDPFIKEAFSLGANPGQYIGQVMASERALRSTDENARFEALLAIADQYRIPLREVINASVGREVLAANKPQQAAVPPELAQELKAQREWRQQQEEQATRREIEVFKKDKEFFTDVAPLMGDMINSGMAQDLADAYEQAIWAHGPTREVLLARQGKKKEVDEVAERQKAAVKVSAKSNESISVKTKKKGDEDESSLEDDIRSAWAEQAGRT